MPSGDGAEIASGLRRGGCHWTRSRVGRRRRRAPHQGSLPRVTLAATAENAVQPPKESDREGPPAPRQRIRGVGIIHKDLHAVWMEEP